MKLLDVFNLCSEAEKYINKKRKRREVAELLLVRRDTDTEDMKDMEVMKDIVAMKVTMRTVPVGKGVFFLCKVWVLCWDRLEVMDGR